MKNKCIAITGEECYNSLRFLSDEFNLKLLDEKEKENIYEDFVYPYGESIYNPFGKPSYWVWINSRKLDIKNSNLKTGNIPQKFIYTKLITSADFKTFSTNVTFDEFIRFFFEEDLNTSYQDHRNEYANQFIVFPKSISNPKPLLKETMHNYIERCSKKYKTEFIYEITLMISSTLEIEFEYRELPSKFMMKNYPNLPPIRIWKELKTVPDNKNIPLLKNLTIDLCNRLESNGIFNYTISPETESFNIGLALDQDSSLSWGDCDPYDLNR